MDDKINEAIADGLIDDAQELPASHNPLPETSANCGIAAPAPGTDHIALMRAALEKSLEYEAAAEAYRLCDAYGDGHVEVALLLEFRALRAAALGVRI